MFKAFICDFQVIQGFDFYDLCSLYQRHLCSIICCTNEIFRAPGFISNFPKFKLISSFN